MGNVVDSLKNGVQCVVIGRLERAIIDLLHLNRQECDILMWADRLDHIEKHRNDFSGDFDKHISAIPEAIANPDYVGLHPTNHSIEYIKRIDDLLIVVVRLKSTGNLAFRTAYPLTEKQLQHYLSSGMVKKMKPETERIDK